jgi:hypothetical protein
LGGLGCVKGHKSARIHPRAEPRSEIKRRKTTAVRELRPLEYPPGIPGIVVETDTREFLLLVGLLVALTIVVLVLLASQQLRHVCQQLTAPDRPDAENEPGNGRPTTAWGVAPAAGHTGRGAVQGRAHDGCRPGAVPRHHSTS